MPQEQTEAVLKRVLEKLAEIEHVRWSQWQNYLHSFLKWDNERNGWFLPHEKKEQWQRQLSTPYSMLSEKEKESDRAEVMKYIPILLQELSTALQQKVLEIRGEIEARKPTKKNPELPNYHSSYNEGQIDFVEDILFLNPTPSLKINKNNK